MTAPIRLAGVTRRYGTTVALDNVDLDVVEGSMTGLLGPNGAGKSTLIGLVAGLRRADSGTVSLFGGPPGEAANRQRLGMTPQETGQFLARDVATYADIVKRANIRAD